MINSRRTPLYNRWVNMRQRCYNRFDPKYPRYGERGIKVCDEWQNFKTFETWCLENGYRKGLTLDRENNDGDYTPGNCRWTDFKTQSNNTVRNVVIKIDGETKTVTQWVSDPRCSVNDQIIYKRLNAGWRGREAVFKRRYERKSA